MRLFAILLSLLAFSVPTLAHGENHDHHLMIEGAWAPHTGKRTMSAAIYLKIKNEGKEDDALIGVQTELANMAMVHESKEVDGIMTMEHVEALPIAAGASASLSPGGYHIMLMRLSKPLKRGEVFPVTLSFENAGEITISVEITGIGGPE